MGTIISLDCQRDQLAEWKTGLDDLLDLPTELFTNGVPDALGIREHHMGTALAVESKRRVTPGIGLGERGELPDGFRGPSIIAPQHENDLTFGTSCLVENTGGGAVLAVVCE